MNQRERVIAAIDGTETSPVPVDVFENGIHPILTSKLCDHFGLEKGN